MTKNKISKNKKEEPIKKIKKIKEVIIPCEYEDELEQNYMSYAEYVIKERALPDVRDGLKPVHRRILNTMNDEKNTHNNSYKKAAKVVGNTMSRFHPHGDSSIYGALVRMSQDFMMGRKLIDLHGNGGSIDGDSPAAMRYCITEKTLINTDKGLRYITELVENPELFETPLENLTIKSIKNKNNANMFFNSGKHPIYELITELNYSIKGTANHPLLILSKDENQRPVLKWKLMEYINNEDYIVLCRDKDNVFSKEELIKKEEAIILGIFLSLGQKRNGNYIISSSNETIINDLKESLDIIYPKMTYFINDIGNTKEIFVKGLELELLNKYKNFNSIPKEIRYSNKEIQKTFLKYYLGEQLEVEIIDNFNIKYNFEVNGIDFSNELKYMLLQFGIISNSKFRKQRIKNRVKMVLSEKIDILNFNEEIGVPGKIKENYLEELCNSIFPATDTHSKTDFTPYINEYLRKEYKHSYFQKYNFNNIEKFRKNMLKCSKYMDKNDFKYLEEIMNPKYRFLKVKSLEKKEEETVYSIRVNSKCHSFVGNGFYNHNTEVRLDKFALEIIGAIDKGTTDYELNYDDTEKEPVVFPSKVPNLLLNGTSGIAVGMASSIPPHNLIDLINTVSLYFDNPDLKINDYLKKLKGPDFPTGGIIVNKDALLSIYESGEGSIVLRSKIERETLNNREVLVVTEIPYTCSGNKENLILSIVDGIKNKKLDELMDIKDESSKEGLRIVLYPKKGIDLDKLENKLYKKTKLQDNFSVNFLALFNGKTPKLFNLRDYLESFCNFQKEIYKKEFIYLRDKELNKKEINEGFLKVHENLDLIIELIRNGNSLKEVKNCLMLGDISGINFKTKKFEGLAKKLRFTEKQATVILEMKLQRLIGLEKIEIEQNLKEILDKINYYTPLIEKETVLVNYIKTELERIKKEYGVKRKTFIDNKETLDVIEVKIIEDLTLVIDHFNYVKLLDAKTIVEDYKYLFNVKSNSSVFIFDKLGQLYQLKIENLPKSKLKDKGTPLSTILNLNENNILKITDKLNTEFIQLTKNGYIKRFNGEELLSNRTQVIYSKLEENDEVLDLFELDSKKRILILKTNNKYLNISSEDISLLKKNSIGITTFKFEENEKLKGMYYIDDNLKIDGKLISEYKLEKTTRNIKGKILK